MDNRRTSKTRIFRDTFKDFNTTLKFIPKQLLLLLGIYFIIGFCIHSTYPYFVTYAKEEIGLTGAQWGLVSTAVTLTSTLIRLPVALASDRYGRLKSFLPSLFFMPFAFYFFTKSVNFHQVLVVRSLLAVLESIASPAIWALITDFSQREHRGRINAVSNLLWSLIASAGSAIGGTLYQGVSRKAPFLVTSAISFIGFVYSLLTLKEPEKREK